MILVTTCLVNEVPAVELDAAPGVFIFADGNIYSGVALEARGAEITDGDIETIEVADETVEKAKVLSAAIFSGTKTKSLTLKFNEEQPRDENGRWTDGVANEISSWDPQGNVPESPRNAGGMTSKTWWAWERGMDGNSFPGYMQAKACEMLGLPVPPNYEESRYYLGRGFGAPNEKQIEGMVNSIANSKPQPELYRGIGIPDSKYQEENTELVEQLKSLQPGDSIDMPLTSTTRSPGVGLWYAEDRSYNKDEPPVLLKFQEGANGVAVGAETSFYPLVKEVVVNGKFEVTNSSEVTMPYWARNSIVLARGMDDPEQVTVRGVKSNGEVPSDIAQKVIETLEKNPKDDLSGISPETLKFTNDRSFSMDNWGEAHVSAWFAQEPKTFHVVELKQAEVYRLADNG